MSSATFLAPRGGGLRSKGGAGRASRAVLKKFEDKYLRHYRAEHVLCLAPMRSRKSVGLTVPAPLAGPGPLIVHDSRAKTGP
ncbi:type IV secretory system conjugative DNA transfer family protein [Methylocystis sp. B8]|uniref:type IV secretory system conjugative DNA transfer family protein n=1 Tax=Methylocystis sp. B8 TaxID=544938 RepID=UPI0010FDB971|nr:type IV secretory system conjugative DNA transfer family protein [Methylocystis sp. B8]TLG73713.1 hypothetical protein FEV16_13195 [Methylocystis sp. B8]